MIRGLYAITPDESDTARLMQKVQAALDGGIHLLQYRNKIADDALQLAQASALVNLCHSYQVPLIINDSVALCQQVNADGVHLGNSDTTITEARRILGNNKMIGASCYNDLSLARHAKNTGADYVAFGACFPSSTKPNAPRATPELFTLCRNALNIPCVAIGGITAENASVVIHAGADAIAVINALFQADDIASTANTLTQLFNID